MKVLVIALSGFNIGVYFAWWLKVMCDSESKSERYQAHLWALVWGVLMVTNILTTGSGLCQ